MVLIDRSGDQPDRLEKSLGSGWFEPGPRELLGHVVGRLAVALAAGVAAFELVIGQDQDVRPPSLRRRGHRPLSRSVRVALSRRQSPSRPRFSTSSSAHLIGLGNRFDRAGRPVRPPPKTAHCPINRRAVASHNRPGPRSLLANRTAGAVAKFPKTLFSPKSRIVRPGQFDVPLVDYVLF